MFLIAACSSPVPIRFTPHSPVAPYIGFSNPSLDEGDPVAGRKAFISLHCIECHRVAEDPLLPRGRRAVAGPMLQDLKRYNARELSNRIVSRSTGGGESLYDQEMSNFVQPMTARQLVDVVGYLRDPRGAVPRS
jgi:mono/diheme cytochrome c family protein